MSCRSESVPGLQCPAINFFISPPALTRNPDGDRALGQRPLGFISSLGKSFVGPSSYFADSRHSGAVTVGVSVKFQKKTVSQSLTNYIFVCWFVT